MSEFTPAFEKTNGNEGLFANNPADRGGMTWAGIARKYWPNWRGWPIIDMEIRKLVPMPPWGTSECRNWVKHMNEELRGNQALSRHVAEFYKSEFWDRNRLGEINSQDVAEWVYDHIVNAGARGAMWIQLAAGVKPDGGVGPKTLAAINAADPVELVNRAEDIAGAYRLDRGHNDPSQLQFLTSWLRRDGQPENIIEMVRQAARDGRLDDGEVAQLKAAMAAVA